MGSNCAPLITDLLFYCYEKDFMSNLHKSKKVDHFDMFNDTFWYLDDMLNIDNHEFEKKNLIHVYIRQNSSWTKQIHVKKKLLS